MRTIVKEILVKEEQMRKNLEAQLMQERETIAMNMLTETNEIVEQLGCGHLIANTNKTVSVTINKGKITPVKEIVKVEVPVEVIKEVEVVKEVPVEKIVEKIVYKEAEPILVPMTDMGEVEKHLATIEQLKKEIAELKKQNKVLKEFNAAPEVEDVAMEISFYDEEQEYLNQIAMSREAELEAINETVIEPVKEEEPVIKEEEKIEEKTNDVVTVKKTNVNMKSSHVGLYQTDRCFLIASVKNDAITWLSDVELSADYKKQVEELLVANHGLMQSRIKTSPVIIERPDAYMARVEAVNNNGNEFSTDDKLSGYVKIDGSFYLYTYKPSMGRAYIDSLNLKLQGSKYARPEADIEAKVQATVKALYTEYQAGCKNLLAKDESSKVDAKAARDARRAARNAKRAEFQAAASKSQSTSNSTIVNSTKTSTVKSRELQKYVDMF